MSPDVASMFRHQPPMSWNNKVMIVTEYNPVSQVIMLHLSFMTTVYRYTNIPLNTNIVGFGNKCWVQ